MNPLTLIPALYRKYLYGIFFLVGVIFGAIQIAGGVDWIQTALNVYAYVGTALGLTAAANVTSQDGPDPAAGLPGPGED